MSGVVTVRLWGTTVGHLAYEPGQNQVATFEYAPEFARSGIQLSPLTMRHPPSLHRFDGISRPTFKGVPGIIADSLPDKFGSQLIDIFMAERGTPPEAITTLDRLLYVGARGMGALEYEPSETFGEFGDPSLALDLATLTELAGAVATRKGDARHELLGAGSRAQGLRLIRVGSSAGGARAKAVVAEVDGVFLDGTEDHGPNARYWLLKFDVAGNADRDGSDPPGMTKVEYIYSELAREVGLDIPATGYVEDGGAFHFLIERFDRVRSGSALVGLGECTAGGGGDNISFLRVSLKLCLGSQSEAAGPGRRGLCHGRRRRLADVDDERWPRSGLRRRTADRERWAMV